MSSFPPSFLLPASPQVQGPEERLSGQVSRLAGKEPSPATTQEMTWVEARLLLPLDWFHRGP